MDAGQCELAAAHPLRQALGEARHGILAIGRDEFLEGREERGIGDAIAVDAVEDRLLPRLEKVVQRSAARFLNSFKIANRTGLR